MSKAGDERKRVIAIAVGQLAHMKVAVMENRNIDNDKRAELLEIIGIYNADIIRLYKDESSSIELCAGVASLVNDFCERRHQCAQPRLT